MALKTTQDTKVLKRHLETRAYGIVVTVGPDKNITKDEDIIVYTVGLARIGLPEIVVMLGHSPNAEPLAIDYYMPIMEQLIKGLTQNALAIAKQRPYVISIGITPQSIVLEKMTYGENDGVFDRLDNLIRSYRFKHLNEIFPEMDYDFITYRPTNWVS